MVFAQKQSAHPVYVTLPSITRFTLMRRMQTAHVHCAQKNKARLLHIVEEVTHNLLLPEIDTDISHEDMQDYVSRIKSMQLFACLDDFEYVSDEIENILLAIKSDALLE